MNWLLENIIYIPMMIKKNKYDVDFMALVIEYRFKNKIITNLHNILLELAISYEGIYEKLIKTTLDEIIKVVVKPTNFDYESIKNAILEYLKKGGT